MSSRYSTLKPLGRPLSRLFSSEKLTSTIEFFEAGLAYLNGKGSGSQFINSGEIEAVASLLPTSEKITIFDVGANNGAWALWLSEKLGNEKSHYFLFECADYCYPQIVNRANQLPNKKLFNVAITDQIGEVTLYCPTRGSGLASLHKRKDVGIMQETYVQTVVQATTVDAIAEAEGVEHIDLLKLDIEGHELAALFGAHKYLSEGRIQLIQFEFGSANINSRTYFRDFFDLLDGYGYTISRILPSGKLRHVDQYSEGLEYFRGATNYIAALPA